MKFIFAALLAALNAKPTLEEVISWIDVETLLLLFGMMVLVAILAQTGVFDYLAVYAFKVSLPIIFRKKKYFSINAFPFIAYMLDYERQSMATHHLSMLVHGYLVGCIRQCDYNSVDGSSYDSSMRNNGIESSTSSYFCRYFLERRRYHDTCRWLVNRIRVIHSNF